MPSSQSADTCAAKDSPYLDGDATTEIGQAFADTLNQDDDWRQMGADDWSGELIPHLDENVQAIETDAALRDALSKSPRSDATDQSVRRTPIKVSLLTRPKSSHGDPAAGFSFSKAKPIQPLDFSRKIALHTALPSRSTASPTPPENRSQDEGQEATSRDRVQQATNTGKSTQARRSSPKSTPTSKDKSNFPFPSLAITKTASRPSLNPSQVKDKKPESRSGKAQHETSTSGEDTLVELEDENSITRILQAGLSKGNAQPSSKSDRSHHGHANATPENSEGQVTKTNVISNDHQLRKVSVQDKPKNEKASKKKRTIVSKTRSSAGPPQQDVLPKEADLLQMLLYKQNQNGRERETLEKALKAKETDYHELYSASEDLYAQLQDLSQRYRVSEAELSKIKEAKPRLESKVQKLIDFVKGLTNDHNQLRDEAKDMRQQQDTISSDKDAMFGILREVYKTTEEKHATSSQGIVEARHDLKVLRQAMTDQQTRLQQEKELLSSERERNDRLEKQISFFTASHAQIIDVISQHKDTISEKVFELLEKHQQIQLATTPPPQDSLRPMLEQCLEILNRFPQTDDLVRPADLEKLNESTRCHIDLFSKSIKDCEHVSLTAKKQQRQDALALKDDLRSFSNAIATEHTLSTQITDLREMKAAVREQLQGTQVALQEARLELIQVQHKNSDQAARIVTLENQTRSQQQAQDAQLISRLQELDALGKNLQGDLDKMEAVNVTLSEESQRKDLALQQVQDQMAVIHREMEELRGALQITEQEKMQFEKQAVHEREEMRRRLTNAADQELEDLKSKHLNALQQLKVKHASFEESQKEASLQMIMMRNEKEGLEKKAAEAHQILQAEQDHGREQATLAERLRLRATELEGQLQEKQTSHESLQQLLRDTELDNQAKDEYIKGMQKAAAKQAARSPSIRKPKQLQRRQMRGPVVEDSQPGGHPKFHEDVMKDFEESELLANEEDLAGLFPATPKGNSHDLEVSRVSYSSTRVTSRDGGMASESRQQATRERTPQQGSQVSKLVVGRTRPGSSASRSRSTFAGSQHDTGRSPPKRSQSQKSSQGSGILPRGILKQTQDQRGEKRSAAEMETNEASGLFAPKRRKSSMTKDLGPIVQDSQPSMNQITGRGRKQTVKRTKKDDKWTIAFAERLDSQG